MKAIIQLIDRIIQKVNINLRELDFDVFPYIRYIGELEQLVKFYGFYGITPHHPMDFRFTRSNLAGSYFLGKCDIDHSVLYKSDIRGDELKAQGEVINYHNIEIPIYADEIIKIKNCFLIKTLVHNRCHDPENLEEFAIQNTVATGFTNIHGSPMKGCFMGPFSTVDLSSVHDCVIGDFSYVQTGEIAHMRIDPGTVWIRNEEVFNFLYLLPPKIVKKYISFSPGKPPHGTFMDFIEARKADFVSIYDVVHREAPINVPQTSALDRYAVVLGDTQIKDNVLISQRAYLKNAIMGKGSNAQENSYIIDSHLQANNVTAHGAKIINATLGNKVFVGFNAFINGKPDAKLTVGPYSIIMPHTIIDLNESIDIPDSHLVWGYITDRKDLARHSLPLEKLSKITDGYKMDEMIFKGNGKSFVDAFQNRIEHILEANGAFFDGTNNHGHAQKNQIISFNMIQPYPEGERGGLFPNIHIST